MSQGLRSTVACLASLALGAPVVPAFAVPATEIAEPAPVFPSAPSQGGVLLEADQLLYDFEAETVTAVGSVNLYRDGFVVDAERVVYDQKSGRLTATGGVRLIAPDGTITTTETLDITDDFRDAFIGSLNVITVDQGRFSAQTGEQRDGDVTVFRRGTYTACQPCRLHPGRPPVWQIKADKITLDRSKRTVTYRNAWMEIMGVPIAYTPYFSHPDPSVKRKTGFLVPSVLQGDSIGFGVTTPFYWNLAPSYDVTFSPTLLSRQGLLGQALWRHRLLHGGYDLRIAGIFQRDRDAFTDSGESLAGDRTFRGSIRTTGSFSLSDQWRLGWQVDATTDRTFNRDYRIVGSAAQELPSTLYLTGSSERNYFHAAGYFVRVQREDTVEDLPGGGTYTHDDQSEQALVHPVIDHNYIVDQPVLGGEFRFDSNLTSVTRNESDIRNPPGSAPYYAGVAGTFTRATSRVSWKRRVIAPGGQLVTPFAYLQADANWISPDDVAAGLTDGVTGRAMPAVGIEYEWPFLVTTGSMTHTIGPRAQLIVRPNERNAGSLPNEDAQSLVFDDTTLFAWDKFSGYDRQEGGTRANLGLVYQGLFPNGASLDALFGQSFQLAGINSFALRDHAQTGIGSGLETANSDYLASVSLNSGRGLGLTTRIRLDDNDLTINRTDLGAVGTFGRVIGGLDYTFLRESPASGIFRLREELTASAKVDVTDNWSVLGALVYDMREDRQVWHSLGLSYTDDCLTLSATYSETQDDYTDLASAREVFFRVSLRTLADGGFSRSLGAETE